MERNDPRDRLGRVFEQEGELAVLVELPPEINAGRRTVVRLPIDRAALDRDLPAASPLPQATPPAPVELPDTDEGENEHDGEIH